MIYLGLIDGLQLCLDSHTFCLTYVKYICYSRKFLKKSFLQSREWYWFSSDPLFYRLQFKTRISACFIFGLIFHSASLRVVFASLLKIKEKRNRNSQRIAFLNRALHNLPLLNHRVLLCNTLNSYRLILYEQRTYSFHWAYSWTQHI